MPSSHGHYIFERDGRQPYHTYNPLPLQALTIPTIDVELSTQLAKAHRLLGKLDGMFCYVQDMDILAYSVAHREARYSCDIERQESLYNERFGAPPLTTAMDQIASTYTAVLLHDTESLSKEGELLDSLRSAHHAVLGSSHDDAGQYRAMQLFVYPRVFAQGGEPFYNPPNPSDTLITMTDLADYIDAPSELDRLIQVALAYYQLVTIRPFSVGNGLTERLFLNFLLVKMGLLSRPLLGISEYLLAYDAEFRDALRLVRDHNRGFDVWVSFLSKVIIHAAEKTIGMLDELHKLRLSDLEKLRGYQKCSPLLLTFYDYLWKAPIIEARRMIPVLNVSYNTVAKAIGALRDLEILEQADARTRYRKFGYKKLQNICYNRNDSQF